MVLFTVARPRRHRQRGINALQRGYASPFAATTVRLQALLHAEFANDVGGVVVLPVDCFVHSTHIVCGDMSGERMKGNL